MLAALLMASLAGVAASCSKSGGESSPEAALPEAQVVEIVNAVDAKDLTKVSSLLQANPKLVSAEFTGGGPDNDCPLLMIAADKGDKAMVELLLRYGANVDARNDDGEAALHYAALEGYTDIAQTLLDHHADVNIKSEIGATPLSLAEKAGKSDVVALLKQHGAKE